MPVLTNLEDRLRAVVPAVRLVRERHLRKVLHELADAGEPVAVNPDLPVWVDRETLQAMDAVPDRVFTDPADPILLLMEPADQLPFERPEGEVLRHYWRLLFRAAIIDTLRKDAEAGRLTAEVAGQRLSALGTDIALEVRFVLEADHVVPHEADDLTLYIHFVAWYAELARFNPVDMEWVFPSLPDPEAGLKAIAAGVPVDRLFLATRPEGAAEPVSTPILDVHAQADPEDPGPSAPVTERSRRLLERAQRAGKRGNHVRAAILRHRAGASGRAAIRAGLVPRLARVLGWDDRTARTWALALAPLVRPAAQGRWPRAAKTLYDLQKIPVDLEGELYTVDPVEWGLSRGRRPLRRPLTRARAVIQLGHLTSARKHLLRARISPGERNRLGELLTTEIHRTEARIRAELGPIIHTVLNEAGLQPGSSPERIAQDKVVEELLDRICERRFLRIGDLRDAISRNQLKMPDLQGPRELLRGDPLLRADERLAVELDGIYHRGEIYLRWIQRGTAVAFGTAIGRWLSKYVAFPFIGAFLTVEFAKYLVMEAEKVSGFVAGLFETGPEPATVLGSVIGGMGPGLEAVAEAEAHEVRVTPGSLALTVGLGVFYLGLLYWPAFRSVVVSAVGGIGTALRYLLVTLPLVVWRSPPIRALRDNVVTRFLGRYFGTATLVALISAAVLALVGVRPGGILAGAGGMFLLSAILASTPLGRRIEDEVAEFVSDSWRILRTNLVPGLIGWILWAFRELVALVERGLYSVDEWFRFREGQPRQALLTRAVVALVWFPIAYLIRFGFMLLLEPQVNPVKHFPVVTVSHKLLLPLIGPVAEATGLSIGAATLLIGCIPGVFGFIAWELKENWRLYAANRPARFPRAVLGHHGETMRGLLRPGFHSGTVPTQFRKLRAALRWAERTGRAAPVGRQVHVLEEVAHAVERFAERELLAVLRDSPRWQGPVPEVAGVRVAVQAITLDLRLPGEEGRNLRLLFTHQRGNIAGQITDPGWGVQLDQASRSALEMALAGFLAKGAVRTSESPTWTAWVKFWDPPNPSRG